MRYFLFILTIVFFFSCQKKSKDQGNKPVESIIEETRQAYAPDKRVAIYDVEVTFKNDTAVLSGDTNLPEAMDALLSKLTKEGIVFKNSIILLEPTYAVINISVANLRSKPKHAAELATQALLGMVLKVYKEQNGWFLVQTPDNYIAWTDRGAIESFENETALAAYQSRPKVIFTEQYGSVFDETGKVSDIVLGGILTLKDKSLTTFEVAFPDGRNGFIKKAEASEYGSWIERLHPTTESLVKSAKELMGLPYLWGGTSAKGVDCSGFTKTVYLMNGLILARDASQQVHTGLFVDDTKNFDLLVPGDLLFFGISKTDTTKERVTHVAMWIGNGRFIHSAGKVKINSMNPEDSLYDQDRFNTYIRSKRMLTSNAPGVQSIQ